MPILTAFLLLAATTPAPLIPTDGAVACAARDTGLPPALAAWTNRSDPNVMIIGPMTGDQLGGVVLPTPAQPGSAAELIVPIPLAKTVTIAIDQPGWINIYPKPPKGSAGMGTPLVALKSLGHHDGQGCSTIAKLVAFKLAAGRYVLVVSGLSRPVVKIMIVDGDQTLVKGTTK